ncbi:hypothetical protein FACS1894111_03360 [Clostridia bacterium]|nr:hypothetical protein FACS1894111_03360 [Clostridia bacterium]
MAKYIRKAFEVDLVAYEPNKGLEDGFLQWSQVVTTGWVVTEGLVKLTRPDGTVVCPFVENRRGMVFLREGDYIITEEGQQRHVCGPDKVGERFDKVEE